MSEPLPVAMAGLKLGDRLLVVGCSDPKLIAALAAKVGLTGRACAVDENEGRSADAARVAHREGVLIETATSPGSQLPYSDDSFDVVVVREAHSSSIADASSGVLQDVRRVLRPGGRCVAIARAARGGISAMFGDRQTKAHLADDVILSFGAAGYLAVRTLAEREGMLFVEGVKKNL